jgi:hypothetical protein
VGQPPKHAAAPISATQQIASASQIVETFNFRFCAAQRAQVGHRGMWETCEQAVFGVDGADPADAQSPAGA